jgi:hypothetical protein
MAITFRTYLKNAVALGLKDSAKGDDGGLLWIHKRCRRGVRANWKALTADGFLAEYLWCVAGIQVKYKILDKYYPKQLELFRQCNPAEIVAEARAIRRSWESEKRALNRKKFDAFMKTAADVAAGWDAFKEKHLPLPPDPKSESMADWWGVFNGLDSLPMVGEAVAWYLIRNLLGGPFFKPDLHIRPIARHFFGPGNLEEQLDRMTAAVRELWPQVCPDERFKPVHMGEADYFLWWYRRTTGDPPDSPN